MDCLFNLPKGVTFVPQGDLSYTFYHEALGELGQLIAVVHKKGPYLLHVTDKQTEAFAMLLSIKDRMQAELTRIYQEDIPLEFKYDDLEKTSIKEKFIYCRHCAEPVAHLLYVDLHPYELTEAPLTTGQNLPCWIICNEQAVNTNESILVALGPNESKPSQLSSTELAARLSKLETEHCSLPSKMSDNLNFMMLFS